MARYERLSTNRYPNGSADHEGEEIELGIHFYEDGSRSDNDQSSHFGSHIDADSINACDIIHRNTTATTALHLPKSRVMQMAIGTVAVILLYLTLSVCLTFYQKEVIKELKFPFTIVSYHLVIKFILAGFLRTLYKWRWGKSRVQLDFQTSVRKMAPTGLASGIDIGFSNWGLELVSISLYTMTKSSTIVFILFCSILLGLEKKSWLLVFTVGLIASGLFMFTYESTQFNTWGFTFLLIASLSSGVRWSLAQFVMQKSKLGLHNPIDMIYYMQPWMILSLLPFLAGVEAKNLFTVVSTLPTIENSVIMRSFLEISFGAILAFFMEVSEFLVVSKTSGLTLSIAGIFKDICQVALAVELYHDAMSFVNVFGLVVCLAGICCHLLHKYKILAKSTDAETSDNANEINANMGNGSIATAMRNHKLQRHASVNTSVDSPSKQSDLTVPLLEQIDSHESSDDSEGPNASDVIFDVLNRRDMSR